MSTSPAKRIVPVYDKAVVALSTLLIGGSFVDRLVAKSLLLPIDLENDLRRQIANKRPDEAARQILNILRKGTDEKMLTFLDVLKQFDGGHELLKLLGEEVSPLPETESAPFEKRGEIEKAKTWLINLYMYVCNRESLGINSAGGSAKIYQRLPILMVDNRV